MTSIIYKGHTNEVVVAVEIDGKYTEFFAANGEPVEVPDELATRLLVQSVWVEAKKKGPPTKEE